MTVQSVVRLYKFLLSISGFVPGIVVSAIAIGVATEVAFRNFGLDSLSWMLEAVEYGLFFITMIGAPYLLYKGQHIEIDLVPEILPTKPRRLLRILVNLIAVLISASLALIGLMATIDSYRSGAMIYKSFEIPEWIPISLIPYCFSMMTVECIRRLISFPSGPKGNEFAGRDAI